MLPPLKPVIRTREGFNGGWVAHLDVSLWIGIMGHGETREAALENLRDLLRFTQGIELSGPLWEENTTERSPSQLKGERYKQELNAHPA